MVEIAMFILLVDIATITMVDMVMVTMADLLPW